MTTTISDFINVHDRLQELNCNEVNGISFLPFNLESAESRSDLVHENSVKTLRTLFRINKIPEDRIEQEGEKLGYRQLNNFEWLAPTIFLASSILSENPHLVSVALGVISNYAADFFKGLPNTKKVKLDIIVETDKNKTYKKINYEGDAEGLKRLADVVNNLK